MNRIRRRRRNQREKFKEKEIRKLRRSGSRVMGVSSLTSPSGRSVLC